MARVRALLAADGAGTFLDAPVGEVAREVLDAAAPSASAELRRVGPYRLIRPLGEGGTGVVHLAVRDDIGHGVALKLLRDAWVSEQRREWFTRRAPGT